MTDTTKNENENNTENNSTETVVESTAQGPGRPALVDEETFVAVWQAADSIDEVAETFFPEATNVDEKKKVRLYCSMRASTLRRKENGPELKTFPRGRKANKTSVDVGEVVNKVEEALAEDGETFSETVLKVAE